MKIVYGTSLEGKDVATLTEDDGCVIDIPGGGVAEAYGDTPAEARAALQELIHSYLTLTTSKWTQALNLVTKSKP